MSNNHDVSGCRSQGFRALYALQQELDRDSLHVMVSRYADEDAISLQHSLEGVGDFARAKAALDRRRAELTRFVWTFALGAMSALDEI